MKTLTITTSRKKHRKWANSSYVAWLTRLWIGGEKETIHLEGKKSYGKIIQACKDVDRLIIAMPVYVDGIPAHVLEFLSYIEEEAKNWHCTVYVATNCGFFEGNQCSHLMRQVRCWCNKVGLAYGGGLGTGGGEMLGILRLTNVLLAVPIGLIVFAIVSLVSGSVHSGLISGGINVAVCIGLYLLWSMGLFYNSFRFGKDINKGEICKDRFTTLWFCGWPLFTAFACIFWVVRALGNRVMLWKMFNKVKIEQE